MFAELMTVEPAVLYHVERTACGVNCVETFDWKYENSAYACVVSLIWYVPLASTLMFSVLGWICR